MTTHRAVFASTPVSRTRGESGFSLVEILVVITIIGLLMTFGFSAMQGAREASKVTKCKKNLSEIGQALLIYKDQRNKGRWPREVGIRFLLTLHRHDQITGRSSELFLCPGTQDLNDLGPGTDMGSAYDDWEAITSDTISYAGRDAVAFPIRGANDAEQVLAADDNEFGSNHLNGLNVLYGDGGVQMIDVKIEYADVLADYPEFDDPSVGIPVGTDSPIELLQVLRVD